MPRKFLFISNIVKFLRVDLALFRQNIDKGEPTDTVRALRFNIGLQTEDIRKTLGPNCSEDDVRKWKVSVVRDYRVFKIKILSRKLRESLLGSTWIMRRRTKRSPKTWRNVNKRYVFFRPTFFVIQIMRSHLWPVYSKLLLTSDTFAIPHKSLAQAYMQKTFGNDRGRHLSGDHITPPRQHSRSGYICKHRTESINSRLCFRTLRGKLQSV